MLVNSALIWPSGSLRRASIHLDAVALVVWIGGGVAGEMLITNRVAVATAPVQNT